MTSHKLTREAKKLARERGIPLSQAKRVIESRLNSGVAEINVDEDGHIDLLDLRGRLKADHRDNRCPGVMITGNSGIGKKTLVNSMLEQLLGDGDESPDIMYLHAAGLRAKAIDAPEVSHYYGAEESLAAIRSLLYKRSEEEKRRTVIVVIDLLDTLIHSDQEGVEDIINMMREARRLNILPVMITLTNTGLPRAFKRMVGTVVTMSFTLNGLDTMTMFSGMAVLGSTASRSTVTVEQNLRSGGVRSVDIIRWTRQDS